MPKSATDSIITDPKSSGGAADRDVKPENSIYQIDILNHIANLMSDEIARNPDIDPRNLPQISSTANRLRLLYEAALFLQHHQNLPEEAYLLLEYAFWENPANRKTLERLESLAQKTGNFERLCTLATQAMETLSSPENKAELCLRIGDWCLNELERSDHAVAYYQKVLEIDNNNLSALNRLIDLYRENEQWEDLAIALAAAAERSQDSSEKAGLLLETARLLQNDIGNVASAAACYSQVLDIDKSCEEAWSSLQNLYLEDDRWWEALALLKNRLEASSDPKEKLDLHLEMARIHSDLAEDSEKAEAEYRAVLEIDANNAQALRELENIYRQNGDSNLVREIIARQIRSADSAGEQVELLTRLAHSLEESAADPEQITSIWESILDRNPSYSPAIENLIHLYETGEQWSDLVRILGYQIKSAPTHTAACASCTRLAQILETTLGDLKTAKKYYKQALSLNPDSVEAMEGLASVYTSSNNWKSANKALKALAELTGDPEKKTDYLLAIGDNLSKQQKKHGPAVEYYQMALSYNENHLPALKALRSAYIKLEDWNRAIQVLTREKELTQEGSAKSTLMAKMAQFYQNIERPDDAIYWYEQAVATDPANREAIMGLVPLLWEVGRHEELEPTLSKLIHQAAEFTDAEKYYLALHLASVRQELGKEKQSLEPARMAAGLDPSSTAALAVYAKALIANNRLQEAHDTYNKLITSHAKEISHADLLEFIYVLGDISSKLELVPQAIDYFSRLLKEKEDHPGALAKIIELYERENNFKKSFTYRLRLNTILQGKQRAKNYMGLGDICIEHLNKTKDAQSFYLEALKITPDDRALLHKLIPVYSEAEQWDKLISTLYKIVKLEDEPVKRARYYYSIGVIYRDKLEDIDSAQKCLTQALDENYNDKSSFAALEEMLTDREDFKTWERCLRKMIFRCHEMGQGESKRALQLWHTLGELYRVRLGDYNAAAMAHQRIAQANPNDIRHRELAAACIFNVPEKSDKAIEEYRSLIASDPDNADYYRPLGNILNSLERYDEAWCVASALYLMGKANSKERKFYEAFAGPTPPLAECKLDEQMFHRLRHPGDSERISDIFAIVLPVLLSKAAEPLRTYGVTKSNAKYKRKNRLMFDLFNYAADCLYLEETPKLYLKKKDQSTLTYMRTNPPQSMCGELYAKKRSEKELLFMVVNHLSYYRPGCLLPRLMPSDIELKSLLTAAMKLGNPVFSHPKGATAVVSRQTNALGQLLSEIQKADLQDAANLFIAANAPSSIRKWRAGIEFTAARAAMLLTGDLVVSASTVRSAGSQLGQLSISKKIADLKAFCVSQEHFELRQSLGICIDEKRLPDVS